MRRGRGGVGLVAGVCVGVAGCGADLDGREAALRAVLEAERQAHLEVDAGALAGLVADTLLTIQDGAIEPVTREQVLGQFRAYFQGASYARWNDLEPPRLRLSADGAEAAVHRRIEVDRSEPGLGVASRRVRFESAWTATYRWEDSGWRMASVTSTFPPPPDEARQIVMGARRAVGLEMLPSDSVLRAEVDAQSPDGPFQVTVHSSATGEASLGFAGGPTFTAIRGGGWTDAGDGERRPLTVEELTFLRGHEIHLTLLDPWLRVEGVVALGETTLRGESVLWLRGRDALDGPVDLYYRLGDTVPAGFTVTDRMNPGAPPVLVTAGPWMDDGGSPALARTATFQQGDERFEYRYRELGWVAPDEAVFEAGS